jgi:hypothetical protein
MDAYTRKRNAELDAERNKQNALQRSVWKTNIEAKQTDMQTAANTRNALAQAYQAPMADRADQDAGMMGVPRPMPTRQEAGQAIMQAGGDPEQAYKFLYGDQARSSYFNFLPTSKGYVRANARTGEVEPITGVGAPFALPVSADPRLVYQKEYNKRTAEADTAGNIEDQRRKAELKKSLPKQEGRIRSLNRQWNITQAKIDEAISEVDGLSTAWPGTILKHVPYTDANKLHNLLLTIKANIGFDRLSEMRANSPTGGALGQVSELENLLLQATQGSLDQNQSPEELKKTLDMIRVNLAQLRAETELAFKSDYAEVLSPPNIQTNGQKQAGRLERRQKSTQMQGGANHSRDGLSKTTENFTESRKNKMGYTLEKVDFDPFAKPKKRKPGYTLEPVDFDPFADDDSAAQVPNELMAAHDQQDLVRREPLQPAHYPQDTSTLYDPAQRRADEIAQSGSRLRQTISGAIDTFRRPGGATLRTPQSTPLAPWRTSTGQPLRAWAGALAALQALQRARQA